MLLMTNVADPRTRKRRTDGQKNRVLILEAANRILSTAGVTASLDEIAQAAGVGNGTMYRHFPNRAALVDAVCREDTRELIDAATTLSAHRDPFDALEEWLRLFVTYISKKAIVAEVVTALVTPSEDGGSSADVRAVIFQLYNRACDDPEAEILDPLDILRAIAGVASIGSGPQWVDHANGLIDIIIAGLKAR
jgi:AcrR family transcriptional regulator